jgi:hypothetical protein
MTVGALMLQNFLNVFLPKRCAQQVNTAPEQKFNNVEFT